ncbi:retrovirus-related pol polyprotein from transposon TNT 1-94 [Tanacetum coccineum]
MTQEFEMTDLGLMKYFLGLEVRQETSSIIISHMAYAKEILKKGKMENSNLVVTPMEFCTKLSKFVGGEPVDANLYRSLFGSLRYLTSTRLGLSYSVGGTESSSKEYMLKGYSDSDQRGDVDDRKSTSGICWSEFTRSTIGSYTDIKVDNKSAIELARNPVHHERSKHIDVRFHFIREHIRNREVQLNHVMSRDQTADIFTKALPGELFNLCKQTMRMKYARDLSLRGEFVEK